VVEAGGAGEALARLRAEPGRFQVVLLDYRLPDRQDLSLLAEIRALAPETAVLMMTAYGDAQMRSEALALGARIVIDKPFQVNSVVALVEAPPSIVSRADA
jgi:DNA-binding NtrC family response regulator